MLLPSPALLPVRVLDGDGKGNAYLVAEGIYRAVAEGADVINLSLATPDGNTILDQAVEDAWDADVTIVAAAGTLGIWVIGHIAPSLLPWFTAAWKPGAVRTFFEVLYYLLPNLEAVNFRPEASHALPVQGVRVAFALAITVAVWRWYSSIATSNVSHCVCHVCWK